MSEMVLAIQSARERERKIWKIVSWWIYHRSKDPLFRALQMRSWQVWYEHLWQKHELREVAEECGGDSEHISGTQRAYLHGAIQMTT